jgi:hypothetical protein
MGRMARRFGGALVQPSVGHDGERSLEDVAVENAVEGCVRETFAALVACWQAAHARDPEVARLMRGVARDETRHAALAWAVTSWAWPRLDRGARARLLTACRRAARSLRHEAGAEAELVALAGLPSAAQHGALVDALAALLWQRALAAGPA